MLDQDLVTAQSGNRKYNDNKEDNGDDQTPESLIKLQ